MKHLSHLRYLLFVLLFAFASACSDDEKKQDPSPKTYNIKVHVVGTRMAVAATDITSEYDFANVKGNFKTGPAYKESLHDTFDKTYDLGKFGDYDIVEVTIIGGGMDAAANLKAEILVDGVVKNSCQIQGTTMQTAYCAVETDNL